jgi:hypothetical protein
MATRTESKAVLKLKEFNGSNGTHSRHREPAVEKRASYPTLAHSKNLLTVCHFTSTLRALNDVFGRTSRLGEHSALVGSLPTYYRNLFAITSRFSVLAPAEVFR